MPVLDPWEKQKIKTKKSFLFMFIYAAILIILPIASCIPEYSFSPPKSYSRKSYSYVPEISEIPLPKGFKAQSKKATVFDTPEGRVVESYASGKGNQEDVIKFYDETLPSLGWEKKMSFHRGGVDMKFEKDDEQLRLNVRPNKAKMTVKFSLYPVE